MICVVATAISAQKLSLIGSLSVSVATMSRSLRLSWCLAVFLSWCRFDVLAVATTLSFDGSQYLKVSLPGSRTEVEDISLRFKTDHPSGLLLATSNRDVNKRARIEMVLMDSRVNLSIDLGRGIQVCSRISSKNFRVYFLLKCTCSLLYVTTDTSQL